MGNMFRKHFAKFAGICQPTTVNQKPVIMCSWFFTLLKAYTETIKNSTHSLKTNRSHYSAISSKSKNNLKLVSSPHNRTKTDLEMFAISCTNSLNIISIVPKIWREKM